MPPPANFGGGSGYSEAGCDRKKGFTGSRGFVFSLHRCTFQAVDPTVLDSILQDLSIPTVKLKFYIALLDAFFWHAVGHD
jgi:hypothetical protein